jgi:rhamnosyltransferase subunit B
LACSSCIICASWIREALTGFGVWAASIVFPLFSPERLIHIFLELACVQGVQARRFFEVGIEACRRLGIRALFVTRYPEQLPAALPPEIRHVAYVPFSQVLPRCKALVHHGGIGTVAQGLAAGVPQFVMAMSHDQPDNGYRLTRLGVGAYVYPKAFTPGRVADRLAHLTTSAGVARACGACRARIEDQMPAEAVFRLLEEAHRTACG